jgi:Family of unknown function (DUF6328)
MLRSTRPHNESDQDLPSATDTCTRPGLNLDHERWNHRVRGETPEQRADRNYHELLQELRVAQIGVQVLFAALLSCAFTERFAGITYHQRVLYVSALILTIVTTGLLMAPAAYHRLLFRYGMKDHVVAAANRFVIAGLAVLVFAMSTGLLLVLDMTLGYRPAAVLSLAVVIWCAVLWCAVPIAKRSRHASRRHSDFRENRMP